jgi:serine/threonine-protein kinase
MQESPGDGFLNANELIPRLFPANQIADNVSGILIGHFRIQKRIGVGGMGSVFLALDERLKRDVALKVLSPSLSLDLNSIQRFQNEAQAAARLDHDNIARVFYSGEEFGLHYIAYEYVPGQNLRDVIRAKGWLDLAEAVNYAIQLTAALHHSSSSGVIHRDIKPSNVLITPLGRAKLVDLGLARKTSLESSLELTMPGTTMGTFDYISPEQARDPHSVDVRSDIYSLGCTLYHMLTGEPPYPEGTVLQKLLDHQAKDTPDPAKKNKRVPPMLSSVVRKMMASQPAHRYASPADLLRDLLLVARTLGAGAVPIDGQVWLTATRFKPPVWQSNFGWVATTCLLCLMVCAVQLYFGLSPSRAPDRKSPPVEDMTPIAQSRSDVRPSGSGQSRKSSESDLAIPNDPTKSVVKDSIFNQSPDAIPEVPDVSEDFPIHPPVISTFETSPVVEKSPVVPVENLPAIQIVNGKSYPSLEAACTEASDLGNSIIELRYNGVREPERPIRLTNKRIIVRAVEGYRPIIRFAVTESLTESIQPHMITVAGGSLELVNVEVVMTVPNRIGFDRWALFSLERPEKVQLKGVTLTIVNPNNKPACAFEQSYPAGQGLETINSRNDGIPVEPPELLLTKSLVRGNGDLVVMREPMSTRFELKDTAVAVDGNLLQLKLVMDNMDLVGKEREKITLELEHFTFRFGQSLLFVEGTGDSTEKLPQIIVDARNNLISCGTNRPLISMRGLADSMDFQRSFSWKGDHNFYDNTLTFLEITTLQFTGNRILDYSHWTSIMSEGIGSNNSPVVWSTKSLDTSYSNVTREYFELAREQQAAAKGASDGYAVGATLQELPSRGKSNETTRERR